MDVAIRSQNAGLWYDPTISGYDTNFWKAITGTPAANGTGLSTVLRLNAAAVATYSFYKYVEATFRLIVPAAPTAGDVRTWGLKVPALTDRNRAEFRILEDVFDCIVFDNEGNQLHNEVLTWDTDWNATATDFTVRWTPTGVDFLIAGTVVSSYKNNNHVQAQRFARAAALHINNENADDMDLVVLGINDVHNLT